MSRIFAVTVDEKHPLSKVRNGSLIGKKVIDPLSISSELWMLSDDIDRVSKNKVDFKQRSIPEFVVSIHRAIENFCSIDLLTLEEIGRCYVLDDYNAFVSCRIDDYDPLYSEAIEECGKAALKLKDQIKDLLLRFNPEDVSSDVNEFIQMLKQMPELLERIIANVGRFESIIDTPPKYSLLPEELD